MYIHEDLSYVRYDDELERLGTGFALSDDPTSFAYVEPDSWLVDTDALIGGYRRFFGETNVTVLDYEDTMARDGSMIPAFTDVPGIDRAALPPLDAFCFNRSGEAIRLPDDQIRAIRADLAERFP